MPNISALGYFAVYNEFVSELLNVLSGQLHMNPMLGFSTR